MSVFVQQTGRVQIQRVTLAAARQFLQTPVKQRPETGQVITSAGEALEKKRDKVDWLATRLIPSIAGTSGSRRK